MTLRRTGKEVSLFCFVTEHMSSVEVAAKDVRRRISSMVSTPSSCIWACGDMNQSQSTTTCEALHGPHPPRNQSTTPTELRNLPGGEVPAAIVESQFCEMATILRYPRCLN